MGRGGLRAIERGLAASLPAQFVAVAVAYVCLAAWGSEVGTPDQLTLWYPPPGLAVAAVFLGGVRLVPAVVLAEGLVSVFVFEVAGTFGVGWTLANAVLVGGAYSLVGVALRGIDLDPRLPRLRDLVAFAGVLLVGALPGAVLGNAVQVWAGFAPALTGDAVRTWYQGDVIGMLALAPAVVLGVTLRTPRVSDLPRPSVRTPAGVVEVALVVVVPIVTVLTLDRADLLYLSLAPIVWVAVRRAHPGSAIAAAAVCGLVATTLALDGGAFDDDDVILLLGVVSLTGLVMGVVAADRFRTARTSNRLAAALARTDDMVAIVDLAGRPEWWNDAAARFLAPAAEAGTSQDEFEPRLVGDVLAGGHERAETLAGYVSGGRAWEGDEELRTADGVVVPVSLVVLPDVDERGRTNGFTLFARDISEQRSYEAELTRRALFDELTGLANRALLQERLHAAVARSRRSPNRAVLLLLDLDRFKVVNDTMGHPAGDELLRRVGARLSAGIREEDTLARLGGDEFTIIAEDLAGLTGVVTHAQAVLACFEEPFELAGGRVVVRASLGVVTIDPAHSPDELLRRADLAMYRAKGRGGNGLAVYDASMTELADRRLRIEAGLRSLLAAPDAPLHYQPVFDLASGTPVFAEALLRADVAELGPVPPPEIVAVAQETGLVDALGAHVLATACRAATAWPASTSVSVNVCPTQLRDNAFPAMVERVLDASGLEPERLVLELTEEAFHDDPVRAADVLRRCRRTGVRVALDDFGRGFSSLSTLRTLPIDVLKLDHALLAGVGEVREADAIVRAVLTVAEALGLVVVAEGIEHADQLDRCRALGCELGQGYALARPMPTADVVVRLAPARH